MSTTLIEELLQAARRADILAWKHDRDGAQGAYDEAVEESRRLRQRAAWVRELEAKHTLCPPQLPLRGQGAVNQYRPCGQCAACVLATLTGPDIPATAPAERTP